MVANVAGWLVVIGLGLIISGLVVEQIVLVTISIKEKQREHE